MEYNSPFLALPDYRTNLILDIVPGITTDTTITDLSSIGNVVTKVATPVRENGGIAVPVLNFGTAGYVNIPDNARFRIASTTKLSFAIVVRPDNADTKLSNLIQKGANNYTIGIRASSGKLAPYVYLNDADEIEEFELFDNTLNVFSAGTWAFYVVVIDNTSTAVKAYVNGELVKTATRSESGLTYSNTANLRLGNSPALDDQFDGAIAMFRVYNEVLTAVQIKQIYQYVRRHILSMSPKA